MVLMWSLRSQSSHGQGHLKVTIILRSRSFWNQMIMCFHFYPEAGGWLSSECLSFLSFDLTIFPQFLLFWLTNFPVFSPSPVSKFPDYLIVWVKLPDFPVGSKFLDWKMLSHLSRFSSPCGSHDYSGFNFICRGLYLLELMHRSISSMARIKHLTVKIYSLQHLIACTCNRQTYYFKFSSATKVLQAGCSVKIKSPFMVIEK